jgi:3-hydroxyisobutyrate dehydrogenase-like beta-hydroxyacid dehydrogenase
VESNGVNMNPKSVRRIALIGFGEVGGIFEYDFAAAGLDVGVFDIRLHDEPSREAMLANAGHARVQACDSVSAAVQDADLVISAVTASAAVDAAREAAPALCRGQVFLDINSVSPETKREIARVIELSLLFDRSAFGFPCCSLERMQQTPPNFCDGSV